MRHSKFVRSAAAVARPKRIIDRGASERGASLVEYAIVVIVSLVMLFGIIDFGRALYTYHFVSHAAREAARWASVNGSTCNGDSINGGNGSCTAPVTCSSGSCSMCTSYGSCTSANTSTDIPNYVQMLAPPGIDTSSTGCGGSACLTTTPSWPVGTACTSLNPPKPTGCSPAICSTTENYPGCTVEVQVSYNFNFLVPLVYKNSITLSSTSEMVIAH